jgi:hypothetical protein
MNAFLPIASQPINYYYKIPAHPVGKNLIQRFLDSYEFPKPEDNSG